MAWLARAEEGRGKVLCGELGVEVRRRSARCLQEAGGASVRRRHSRASRGGTAWSGRQRRGSWP